MFLSPSTTTRNNRRHSPKMILNQLRKEMARLGSDCRGFLDFRMILILMLLGGGGFGGFALFSQPSQPAKPTATAQTNSEAPQEEAAESAIENANQQAESMLNQASADVREQAQSGASLNQALATFREDVSKAQSDLKKNINSALTGLASGISPQQTIQRAVDTFRSDLDKARSQFQQSLQASIDAIKDQAEALPDRRPIVFDLACDVAESVAKARDPLAQVCKNPAGSSTDDSETTGDNGISGEESNLQEQTGGNGNVSQDNGLSSDNDEVSQTTSPGDSPESANTNGDSQQDNFPETTSQFPVKGLYRENELVVDGHPVSCGSRPIFISQTIDNPNGGEPVDFVIKDYVGGSENRDGDASRDRITLPDTLYLNQSTLQAMSTADKLETIRRGCQTAGKPQAEGPGDPSKATGEFPVKGLYRSNDLVVDGWPISCENRAIFVSETIDNPNGGEPVDFVIKDYVGGSENRDGDASRDRITLPDTLYLNQSTLQAMSTADKLETIRRGCQATGKSQAEGPNTLLKATGQFPVKGLYRLNDLVVDGWPISCGNRPIFVSETVDNPDGDWPLDFAVRDYVGGSVNRDGQESRDYGTFQDTLYLNKSRLKGMSTAHKLATISRACYRADNPGTTGTLPAFKEESCFALQKGLREGWMTDDFAQGWCYRQASRGCNRISTACDPGGRWMP